jgi:hypothetical protein
LSCVESLGMSFSDDELEKLKNKNDDLSSRWFDYLDEYQQVWKILEEIQQRWENQKSVNLIDDLLTS